jgi:hypothetical protein
MPAPECTCHADFNPSWGIEITHCPLCGAAGDLYTALEHRLCPICWARRKKNQPPEADCCAEAHAALRKANPQRTTQEKTNG